MRSNMEARSPYSSEQALALTVTLTFVEPALCLYQIQGPNRQSYELCFPLKGIGNWHLCMLQAPYFYLWLPATCSAKDIQIPAFREIFVCYPLCHTPASGLPSCPVKTGIEFLRHTDWPIHPAKQLVTIVIKQRTTARSRQRDLNHSLLKKVLLLEFLCQLSGVQNACLWRTHQNKSQMRCACRDVCCAYFPGKRVEKKS